MLGQIAGATPVRRITSAGRRRSWVAAKKRGPRIAFIDYFPTHYRRRLYEEIATRADADFYFYSDQQERWSDANVPAVWHGDYRRIDLPRRHVLGEPVMPGVVRRILSGDYDAVIKSPNGKLMLSLVYGAARASGTAFVLWSGMWKHPSTALHRLSKPMIEGIYRNADAIVAYGEHVRRFVLETDRVESEKVFVAGQAVDSRAFEAITPQHRAEPPEILFVGQLKEMKGLPYLFDAFDRLADTDARLRLIGGGEQAAWVRSHTESHDHIEFVGYRSQAELPAEIARARCLVLPSVTTSRDKEPWGLVVNEALHAGIPVVVSDAVGAAAGGLVRDGRNGLVVPERNAAALAQALRRLIEDPDLAARMGAAGREDAAAFSYNRMASAFLDAVDYSVAALTARRQAVAA